MLYQSQSGTYFKYLFIFINIILLEISNFFYCIDSNYQINTEYGVWQSAGPRNNQPLVYTHANIWLNSTFATQILDTIATLKNNKFTQVDLMFTFLVQQYVCTINEWMEIESI